MSNQQAGLPAGWLLQKLREALAQLPGGAPLLPSLPVLEVGVMGQHLVVMFCLGSPPPTLLETSGSFAPAVTLHLIWPAGYWYWQPETGTADYIGGGPRPELLPVAYQQVLRQRSQQPPYAAVDSPAISRYLALIEEVLLHDWLSPHPAVSPAEKQVAGELQQLWSELGEAQHQAYYQARGSVLLSWLTQATYQPCWVEEVVETLATAAPPALLPADASAGALFPAWLDGQQCVVMPFFKPAPVEAAAAAVELVAACYVAYPTREIYWHFFSTQQAQALLATHLPPGQLVPTALQATQAGYPPAIGASRHYYQLVTKLLKAGWLVTRYPTAPGEATLAGALTEAFAAVRTPKLTAYYLREAWQLLGWLARAAKVPHL